MQVEPQTPLPLVYQINDHMDASRDSYYVRAVVRDSLTGATIQSKNLSSAGLGTGRYTSQFGAPVDGTGLGRQIDVTTTVYSDSGYTTKHASYAEVLERWYVKSAPVHYGGGNTSEDIDYARIEKILKKAVKDEFDGRGEPAPGEQVNLTPLQESIASVIAAIDALEMPEIKEPEKINLDPVLNAIAALETAIAGKIDTIPESDLDPVIDGIQNLAESIGEVRDGLGEHKAEIAEAVTGTVRELFGENDEKQEALKGVSEQLQALMKSGKSTPKTKTPEPTKFPKIFRS